MKYHNNPCNIRYTGSKWLGLLGSHNGFCRFETVAHGVRVVLYLFLRTYPKRHILSINDCIYTFCPAGDGDNNPSYYVTFVCGDVLNPFKLVRELDVDQLYFLIKRMCILESNYNLSREIFDKAFDLFKNGR